MITITTSSHKVGKDRYHTDVWVSFRGMTSVCYVPRPAIAPYLNHPLTDDEAMAVFGKNIEDTYHWFQWTGKFIMFNRGQRKNLYSCPMEKLQTAIWKRKLSHWEKATPIAPDIEYLWQGLYVDKPSEYTIQYHESILKKRLPFLATCDSCGYTAAEHTFAKDRDFFNNPFISCCPGCKRHRAPGELAILGDRPLTFTVKAQDDIIYWAGLNPTDTIPQLSISHRQVESELIQY